MSHFFAIVLVPLGTEDIEEKVAELLAPFDANIEVAPYEQACSCVGAEAWRVANGLAEVEMGEFQPPEDLAGKHYGDLDEAEQERWDDARQTWEEKFYGVHEAYFRQQAHAKQPDPSCEECGGSGKVVWTYNPRSKWDYWRIGGRWDGAVRGIEVEDDDHGFFDGPEHQQLERNVATVEDVLGDLKQRRPFALVTPDGAWHEQGEMGAFAMVYREKRDSVWLADVRQLLEQCQGHLAVGCDLHI